MRAVTAFSAAWLFFWTLGQVGCSKPIKETTFTCIAGDTFLTRRKYECTEAEFKALKKEPSK